MSSNVREKLTAQFRVPSLSKFQAKRGRSSTGESRDVALSQDSDSPREKVRRISERDGNIAFEDSEDDEEGMAMSLVQLDRHSARKTGADATDAEQDRINAQKAMNARLERINLQKRAQELKESREKHLQRTASSSSVNARKPGESQQEIETASYYLCMYRAPQTKKHKSWDNDGFIKVIDSGRCRLYDLESKRFITEDTCQSHRRYHEGSEFFMGSSREVQITQKTSRSSIFGASFSASGQSVSNESHTSNVKHKRDFKPPASRPSSSTEKPPSSVVHVDDQPPTSISSSTFYGATQGVARSVGLSTMRPAKTTSLYDPEHETGLIAMRRPSVKHQRMYNRKGLPVVDVHIEPRLAEKLRPHQIDGIRFLYDGVMDLRDLDSSSCGVILADDMGLGKTVQTIAVIQMLLKQSCYAGAIRNKVIERAVVVCPSSLVKNWRNEFLKWTGNSLTTACVDQNTNIKSMINGRYDVLIINYEKLRTHVKDIAEALPHFGLLVCDEAHRIKSKTSKTTKAFEHLRIDRRILLTGTPIQNNLSEFHAMMDFIAPSLLCEPSVFKNLFEDPIVKGRRPGATRLQKKAAEDRSTALRKITEPYILRREASILSEHLPPKYEQVIFCSPSKLQMDVYTAIRRSDRCEEVLSQSEETRKIPLEYIIAMRKLCNAPDLLIKDVQDKGNAGKRARELLGPAVDLLPGFETMDVQQSGKLTLLVKMLRRIRKCTDDKVVVISNFTATLDIVEAMCKSWKFSFERLDGKTKQSERMSIVGRFNRTPPKECFLFLLSSKTGGAGLNLIGANRLIMLDCDWNPANDAQAMARIHRDGQKKVSYIYRLLLSGTMDEKIFQRQLSKTGLSNALMGSNDGTSKAAEDFSPAELKDIFRLKTNTPCKTHTMLGCSCGGSGLPPNLLDENEETENDSAEGSEVLPTFQAASRLPSKSKQDPNKRRQLDALMQWSHHNFARPDLAQRTEDDIVNELIRSQHERAGSSIVAATDAVGTAMCLDDNEEEEEGEDEDNPGFRMSNVEVGSVLYVFAKKSAKAEDEETIGTGNSSEEVVSEEECL